MKIEKNYIKTFSPDFFNNLAFDAEASAEFCPTFEAQQRAHRLAANLRRLAKEVYPGLIIQIQQHENGTATYNKLIKI